MCSDSFNVAGITVQLAMLVLALVVLCNLAGAEELVVFGGEAFQPQIYLDNGIPTGVIPKMLERLSADTGDTYKLILLPWKRAISEATAGHGGITSFSFTRERALLFDYSDPLVDNPMYITVLRQRADEFHRPADIKGKRLGVPLGTSFGADIDRQIAAQVFQVDYDNGPESRIRKLLAGRIDAAVIGQDGIRETLKLYPELAPGREKLFTLPFPLEHDWQYLAFPKSLHRQEALQRFNKALAALKKTREYQKIIDDNSGH